MGGTTTEPATDAQRGPHVRTSPHETDLPCHLGRLAVGSCSPTPEGSQPLSRMMSYPLSDALQAAVHFLARLRPAAPSARLAARLRVHSTRGSARSWNV